MAFLDSALKLGAKGLTLGKKLFGVGAPKASWSNKYAQVMGKKTLVQKANKLGVVGRYAGRGVAGVTAANAISRAAGGPSFGGNGPEGDEFKERAYNQLRYGVDMTNSEMEEAHKGGQQFQDTGLVGEGGLNEEQVLQYLDQEGEDKRGTGEKVASAGLSALAMVPGLGTLLGTPAEMYYDKKTKEHRMMGLNNAVQSLKLDANAMKMRRDMEKKQGKFMTQGLLGDKFGTGNVSGISTGGIKPPVDREAQAEEAEALKEYEAIKAKDGVHAALAHPSALKAGRQVYVDVQEASGGDKNTAEALLSGVGGQEGVGLTDQPTMEKYYGNPEANAASNQKLADEAAAKQTAAQQAAAAAAAQTSLEAQDKARSGEISLKPAENPEEVVNNQATIATQKGYYGQSPVSIEQQAYMNARGQKSDVQMQNSLNSPEWKALFERHQKQATANAQAARNYIAPEHRMGVDPNGQAARDKEAARIFNPASGPVGADGKPLNPSAPAPATAPLPAQVNAAANTTPAPGTPGSPPPDIGGPARRAGEAIADGVRNAQGAIRGAVEDATTIKRSPPGVMPGMTPEQKYGPQALEEARKNGTYLGTNPNLRLPDIGAPARRMGEAAADGFRNTQNGIRNFVENATTMKGSPGAPMPGMKPTPYGLGTGTAGVPSSIPQGIPDIGAPVRNAVQGALTQRSSTPGNVMKPSPYGLGTATPGVPTSIPQGIPDIGAPVRNAVQGALTQKSSPPGVVPPAPNNTPAYDAKGNLTDPKIAEMLAEQKRKEIAAKNAANKPRSTATRPDPMSRFR